MSRPEVLVVAQHDGRALLLRQGRAQGPDGVLFGVITGMIRRRATEVGSLIGVSRRKNRRQREMSAFTIERRT